MSRGKSNTDKPLPNPVEVLQSLIQDAAPFKEQVDRNAKVLSQAALRKLDVVSRAEFDAQAAVLERTRSLVKQLETRVQELTQQLDALDHHDPST
jgi:BMFP domain-containing protein YqiC